MTRCFLNCVYLFCGLNAVANQWLDPNLLTYPTLSPHNCAGFGQLEEFYGYIHCTSSHLGKAVLRFSEHEDLEPNKAMFVPRHLMTQND